MDLTRETPAPGLVVWQPRRGYRYGVEVYLLADFALRGGPAESVVDLGCGSGVLGLLLSLEIPAASLVDREPRWVELARRSAADSGRGEVIDADVRGLEGRWALAVANPPWFSPAEPIPPDPWKASARAMLHGDVDAFVEAGLRVAPRLCLVTRRPVSAPPGAHCSRVAKHGEKLRFTELRRGEGVTVEEPVDVESAYRRFRG